jgi:phage terminase large subunit-like protein
VTESDTAFLAAGLWAACKGPKVEPEAYRGRPLYLGGDLSKTTDLTALVALWPDDGESLDCKAWFWMPDDNVLALEQRDRVPYRHWIEQGWIIATNGEVVDYESVRQVVNELGGDHDLRKLMLDPYNATKLAIELRDGDGIAVEFIRQGFLSLSAPTKELERLIKSRRIRHDGNPVLAWMLGNAVLETDAADNIKLSKKKSRKKIDGAAALVNAVAAMTEDEGGSVSTAYDNGGIFVL